MKLISILFIFIFLYCFSFIYLGFGINITNSMPKGLYIKVDKDIEKGDIVSFCLQNEEISELAKSRNYLRSGSCNNGLKPLLKRVVGLEGDFVNTNELKIQEYDSKGKEMPSLLQSGNIPKGKALVLADDAYSFDSRYFGLVDIGELTPMKQLY